MLNPCHFVILMQGYLLTTEKTKISGAIFITYLRWLFGPWFALIFPDLDSYQLPFELSFFYIEHYLAGFIGPAAVMLGGRYGYFRS